MESRVSYAYAAPVATITMDDGKVNVMSPRMLAELGAAFDRAEDDDAIVVLTGRPGVFSAGFDLTVLRDAPVEGPAMVRAGFELAARILVHPRPVIAASPGHAIAMGSFLLLGADYRLGADGPFTYAANEVSIGIAVPTVPIELLRARLTPSALQRAVGLSERFDPTAAAAVGFLDRVVAADELLPAAHALAATYAQLDPAAHTTTKLRARRATINAIRAALDGEPLL